MDGPSLRAVFISSLMLAQLESGACSTWVYWAWFYLTLVVVVVVVLVEGRSLTSGQRLSIGFPSGKKPPRTALSDHNQTKQQAHKQPTHTWEEGEGGKFWKEMFSFDALDWAGIWPKAVAGGCKPVYQMKWETQFWMFSLDLSLWLFVMYLGRYSRKSNGDMVMNWEVIKQESFGLSGQV